MTRRLRCTRRSIALDRLGEYLSLWRRGRDAVRRHGGQAWLFRSAARDDHFLEFIEYDNQEGLSETRHVTSRLQALSESFPPDDVSEWEGVEP